MQNGAIGLEKLPFQCSFRMVILDSDFLPVRAFLLLNLGYVRLIGANRTGYIQLFEHLGAYVRGVFMCRVLDFRFLQPLPIWNLLERPW